MPKKCVHCNCTNQYSPGALCAIDIPAEETGVEEMGEAMNVCMPQGQFSALVIVILI